MAKRKRVALFINSLCGGGAERVVSRISKELDKEYVLYIFLIEGKKIFYECSGTIVDLGCGSERYIVNAMHAFVHINKAIRKYRIDCVISFLDVPNIINCLVCRNVKRLVSIRNYSSMELCKTWNEKIKFVCLQKNAHRVDKIISVSNELGSELIKCFHVDKTKVCVIENPYNITEIRKQANDDIEDKVWEFIKNNKTAVAVGRLNVQKGYDDLISIFAEVYRRDHSAALIILGEGGLKEELENKIREKQLEKRVLLLGLCDNPFAYISRCQLFVSCSLHEGFPNALVEAMACGLPVIHTDCKTGPREILTASSNESGINNSGYSTYGVLIPSYTRNQISKENMQKEYVEAWVQLLSSDELRVKYSCASIKRAGYYSMERCIKRFQEVIEEVFSYTDSVDSEVLTKTYK